MTPGQFLRLIWPDESDGGHYCIAHPFTPEGTNQQLYYHKVFETISEAVTHCLEQRDRTDTYFAMLTLKEEKVWLADKVNKKTGEQGAWATRVATNMKASKCSFWDIDVGDDPAKYATQRDALAALAAFLGETKLPIPTLLSSGGGVHVYWHFAETVPVDEWSTIALQMKQLADALKLKIDPKRTTDASSVLRVLGTKNWKDRANPRAVELLGGTPGAITPVAEFRAMLQTALIRAGETPQTAPPPRRAPLANPFGEGNMSNIQDFGPPPTLSEVAATCGQVQEILRSYGEPTHPYYGKLDNNAWYHGMLPTIKFVEDGDNWCRKLTDLFPRTNADIDFKLNQLEMYGPARCETVAKYMPWGDSPCQKCRFFKDDFTPNPLAATRKTAKAPPPVVMTLVAPGAPLQSATIPNPPKPWERLKTGQVARTFTNKDDEEITEIVLGHDLYPVRILANDHDGVRQQVWCAALPREGSREFTIDADVLYDSRKFCASMAHNGIYPSKAQIGNLQDYMVAYITRLQKEADAEMQHAHLGWIDGYRQFVLPDKVLHEDGSVTSSSLTKAATTSTEFVTKRGEMQKQVELLRFYNDPRYVAHQSAILDGLASIIYYATGHHGIVVNMSGDAGSSKSTALYTAASHWGDPTLFPINGTNRGATANARMQRLVTNANLPTLIDEITHLPPRDAMDLVMGITQPGSRLRLNTDGSERRTSDEYKSAIMVSTANSSLHSLLSIDNAAGTAGSMRVFELKMYPPTVHTKAQADEYLRQLRLHFGWTGEIFAQFVIRNRVAVEHRVQQVVREIDTEAKITSGERFWSARIAAGLVAAEIAKTLGLLQFDPAVIRRWTIESQIPFMRGVVQEEYRDSLAILSDYIATSHSNIAMIERTTGIGANTGGRPVAAEQAYNQNNPHGALLGHYDTASGMLYLLKQGFKDYCTRIGSSSSRILDELYEPRPVSEGPPRRIVIRKTERFTLGKGTGLAKGQSRCFVVDLKHPDVAGQVDLNG